MIWADLIADFSIVVQLEPDRERHTISCLYRGVRVPGNFRTHICECGSLRPATRPLRLRSDSSAALAYTWRLRKDLMRTRNCAVMPPLDILKIPNAVCDPYRVEVERV